MDNCNYPQCGTHQELSSTLVEVKTELKGIRTISKWVLTAMVAVSGLVLVAIYSAGGVVQKVEHNAAAIDDLKLEIKAYHRGP